ncbi:MAG TPA: hypothetical protein VMV10_26115 [Pirellulales bacterium]|nr:hypothetical protein [Pirellulales bacterium]HVB82232.1 hypothetical protein [Candidatus Binataceae bacterium]
MIPVQLRGQCNADPHVSAPNDSDASERGYGIPERVGYPIWAHRTSRLLGESIELLLEFLIRSLLGITAKLKSRSFKLFDDRLGKAV